jgi:hypothetical protein
MKYLVIAFVYFLFLAASTTVAQTKPSTNAEIIIRVDGEIVFCTVTEITPDVIKYVRTDLPASPSYTILREEIYAIVHANQTKEVITPVGTASPSKKPSHGGKVVQRSPEKDSIFDYNIKHGMVRVGLGFVRNNTSIDASKYKVSADSPGLLLAYVFRFNRFLQIGAQIGFNRFTYTSTFFSAYDQAIIDQKIKDKVITPVLFGKYNLTNTFIKPYLIGGIGLNISDVSTQSNVLFIDTQRGTTTSGNIRGSQFDIVLRGGIDLSLSSRFGGYVDIGTGTNLVQIGALFNLQ